MAKRAKPCAEVRAEAARLFAEAQAALDRRDYAGARECYEQSLKLYEKAMVRAAYMRFLAMIRPM